MFSGSEITCNSIFRRFGLILVEIFAVLSMVLTCKFIFRAILQRLISALWPNEIGKRSLSKVVQQVRQLNFQNVQINTCGDFRSFINGTNLRIYFFFRIIIQRLISALWSNVTGKRSISKVVLAGPKLLATRFSEGLD